jgi:hypothetical protein
LSAQRDTHLKERSVLSPSQEASTLPLSLKRHGTSRRPRCIHFFTCPRTSPASGMVSERQRNGSATSIDSSVDRKITAAIGRSSTSTTIASPVLFTRRFRKMELSLIPSVSRNPIAWPLRVIVILRILSSFPFRLLVLAFSSHAPQEKEAEGK